jgi:sugar O-acyltransferase (sialic acid O-acetyltransferase NeuD family)
VTRDLVILGAGGNAYDVLDIVDAINAAAPTWSVLGFLDDRRDVHSEYLGLKVLGGLRDAGRFPAAMFLSTIRNEQSFRSMPKVLSLTGLGIERYATLVHPSSGVSSRATLGRGAYVCYGASVGGGVVIGDHVSLGPGVIIGHDSVIGDCSILAAGAVVSGGVNIEQSCYIGSGSMIRQSLRIGTGALVGLGAVVVKGVSADTTVVGNPAAPIGSRSLRNLKTVGVAQ